VSGGQFSDETFWEKLRGMPAEAGRSLVERAVLLYVMLTDADTPLWARVLVLGALAYLVNPLDAVPDFLPAALGYADDAALLALAAERLSAIVTLAMRARAAALLPWN
jgi:uncharacterized membrane protein YkvA (DUF1232 family)